MVILVRYWEKKEIMNRITTLLVIAQFICLSQSAQVKRASDACPGANNKNSTSKDYAYMSKRKAGDSDFSKPKYQSIYAKNTTANTSVKRGSAIVKEERTVNQRSSNPEKQSAPPANEEKVSSGKTILSSEPKEEVQAEFIESVPSDKKMETSKPFDVIQTEKTVSPEPKNEPTKEEGKTASSKKSEKATSKSGSTKSTDTNTAKVLKQKKNKKNTIKKLRVGKKCATDCPEF